MKEFRRRVVWFVFGVVFTFACAWVLQTKHGNEFTGSLSRNLGFKDLSVFSGSCFAITEFNSGKELLVSTHDHPERQVVFRLNDSGDYSISVVDKAALVSKYKDSDNDGVWNERVVSTPNHDFFVYRKHPGIPDIIIDKERNTFQRMEEDVVNLESGITSIRFRTRKEGEGRSE